MSARRLLRSQKNKIFEELKSQQINHFDFEITDTPSVFKLFHKDTGHFLEIAYNVSMYNIAYSPGDNMWEGRTTTNAWFGIEDIVKKWVSYLAAEVAQPDYWGDISLEGTLLSKSNSIDNTLFTDTEKIQIKNKVNQIEKFILENYEINSQGISLISDKLDRLEQKAELEGRSDWLHTAVGIIFTIIVGIALAPNQAKELMQFSMKLFSEIYGGGFPVLP